MLFRERDIGELIRWTPGNGPTIAWSGKISGITPGSSVGVETDEGDLVKINVTNNVLWNFTGSVVDIRPDPPRSQHIADLQVGDSLTFGEPNLIFVFSVPKQSTG